MSIGEALYAIILYPIVQIIEVAYKLFSQLFNNTGIAVMGVSFVVTVLCLPLYIVAERWQQLERDTQARLKNGVDRIKAVFKGDEQYMILSTYYRQNHYHPMMALRSSFGLLIQVPFFMAAYSCLSNLPALQGQSFLFIRDMGAPDALFSIGDFGVNVLPIAMTAINIIAGAIYTKGFPFKEKAQIYGMALLFLVILYNSPAGLVLYWTMNNVFSLVKNIFYKLKHPIKVLYLLMCAGIALVDIYILFVYGGSASIAKRLAAVFPFTCLVFVPYLVRGVNWLLDNKVQNFVNTPPPIKLRIFIPVALAWALLSGLVLPSSLIASSVSEFSDIGSFGNPAVFLWYSCFQSLGVFVFWPLCIFFLFKERIQTLLTMLFSMGFVCSVVNSFVFMVDYGPMDLTLAFTHGLRNPNINYMIINSCVIILLISLILVLFAKQGCNLICSIVSIAFVAFSILGIVNIKTIQHGFKEYESIKAKDISTVQDMEPVFTFTKTGKNVLVLMLDRGESAYFDLILQDRPKLRNIFKGFVYYKNTVSFSGGTLMGSPGLYGGYEYAPAKINARPDVLLKEKHNESLLLMPRIFTEQADFNAIMCDSSLGNYSSIIDMSFVDGYEKIYGISLKKKFNSYVLQEMGVQADGTQKRFDTLFEKSIKRNLLWCSFLRESISFFKSLIYYRGTYFNPNPPVTSAFDWYSALEGYSLITNFEGQKDQLFVITNELTHDPLQQELVEEINDNQYSYQNFLYYTENVLALESVGKWLNLLQDNGVYDNTRIIIVSDHGTTQEINGLFSSKEFPNGLQKKSINALLLYKDFYSNDDLKTDMTFMSNADVPTLALDGIVENPINPFTGNPVNSDTKLDGVYISTEHLYMAEHSKSEYIFTVPDDSWYHVKDNIFVDSNWTQEVPR